MSSNTNNDFEVKRIKNHAHHSNSIFYHIEWKACNYTRREEFAAWQQDIKKVIKLNKKHFVVFWKDSWLEKTEMVACDELVGVYHLLQLMKQANCLTFNSMKQN